MNKLTTHKQLRSELIEKQEFKVTSLEIAEVMGKEHKSVLKSIRKNFSGGTFAPTYYLDTQGKERPLYLLTKKQAMFIVMSYTGKRASEIKWLFLDRIEQLENIYNKNKEWKIARQELKELTRPNNDIYKAQLEKKGTIPKFYHYSNKENLLMQAATGYTATQFKRFLKENLVNAPKNIIVRDFLIKEVIAKLTKLNTLFTELIERDYRMSEIKEIMRIKPAEHRITCFIDKKYILNNNLLTT